MENSREDIKAKRARFFSLEKNNFSLENFQKFLALEAKAPATRAESPPAASAAPSGTTSLPAFGNSQATSGTQLGSMPNSFESTTVVAPTGSTVIPAFGGTLATQTTGGAQVGSATSSFSFGSSGTTVVPAFGIAATSTAQTTSGSQLGTIQTSAPAGGISFRTPATQQDSADIKALIATLKTENEENKQAIGATKDAWSALISSMHQGIDATPKAATSMALPEPKELEAHEAGAPEAAEATRMPPTAIAEDMAPPDPIEQPKISRSKRRKLRRQRAEAKKKLAKELGQKPN